MATTNGITGYVKFDECECGKKGFREERHATAYMLNKRRLTEAVDVVECPVGSCFHPFNPTIRDKAAYIDFLTETAASVKQPRPALPPSRPLTQNLPLPRPRVELSPSPPRPPPTPSPALSPEARSCLKVRYASEDIARFHLANMPEGRDEQRVYECSACGDWHLTSHEYDPSQIVEKKLMTFGHEPHAVTVVEGRYPDGKVASITLRHARAFVRIRVEHFPLLASVLAFVGARPPMAKSQSPSPKTNRPMRILEMLTGREMTTSEVAHELGVSTHQTRSVLATMRKSGRIEYGAPVVRSGQTLPTWRLPGAAPARDAARAVRETL
jgi:hypothetical protein